MNDFIFTLLIIGTSITFISFCFLLCNFILVLGTI